MVESMLSPLGEEYIDVRVRAVIPFGEFLKNQPTDNLQVIMPSDASKSADFAFRGVFIDFKGTQKAEESLTIKHLLYLYYHHIFGIATYTIIENFGTDAEKCILINEYERIFMNYPLPKNRKNKKSTHPFSFVNLPGGARLFPIKVWQEDKDAFRDIKKVLGKFAPNIDYDKREEEGLPELSLQTGEIFDYFLLTTKSHIPDSLGDVRAKLATAGCDSNMSDEVLQAQIDKVSFFLSNIIK